MTLLNRFANCDSLSKFATQTVDVAQLVRAPDCDSGGRGFEPRLSPQSPLIGAFLLPLESEPFPLHIFIEAPLRKGMMP